MKYTDIIFDFDGTLSDTYPCFANAFLDTCRDFSVDCSYERAYDLLKKSVGHAMNSFDFGVPHNIVDRSFHDYHCIRAVTEQKPFPDASELLEFIRKNGGRSYIYSHSGIIVQQLVNIWGWREYFCGVIDARLKVPRKPDPTGLNHICEKYSIDKSRAIMVGDRDIDTDAGKNAGIDGCLFDPENYYPETCVKFRINKLTDLENIIL